MNLISRTITGVVIVVLGLFLIVLSFFSSYWILTYGIPVFIIGVFILFNKKEDKIEQIRSRKKVKG